MKPVDKNLFCNLQAAFWGPHQSQKHWFRNCVIYITHNWEFPLPVKMSFWCWHNLPIQCLTTLKKLPKIGTGRMFHSTILWFQIVIHLRDRRRGGRKYKWMFICDTCKCPWIGGASAAGWQFPRCLSKGILIYK